MSKITSEFSLFIKHLLRNRKIIFSLAYNDFKTKYAGSILGGIWAFIKPVVIIIVFWFVFQVGLKSTPIENFPFVLWLITALIPWFFFSDALLGATNSLYEYSYLVKKVKFRVSVLPMVKILSSFFVHIFFFILIFLMYIFYKYPITIYSIQVIYYTFAMIILLIGLSWVTSSLAVFLKDVGQFVEILLQILIWLTPILWNYKQTIPESKVWLLKLNPLFYIVDGFRDSFINQIWFFNRINDLIYFWAFTLITLLLGAYFFAKLRRHFADVL
ncbi:ABC transporter permease [Mycoplasmatota bacterium]|nr:ABC transporter permease [Mycoplasmatota bacterium]